MALSVAIPSNGSVANYHRIEVGEIIYSPDGQVENSKGKVVVAIRGYGNQEAHISGQPAITNKGFMIYFGSSVADYRYPKGGSPVPEGEDVPAGALKIVTIKSDEPTRADIYAAVKQLPEFLSATDA